MSTLVKSVILASAIICIPSAFSAPVQAASKKISILIHDPVSRNYDLDLKKKYDVICSTLNVDKKPKFQIKLDGFHSTDGSTHSLILDKHNQEPAIAELKDWAPARVKGSKHLEVTASFLEGSDKRVVIVTCEFKPHSM